MQQLHSSIKYQVKPQVKLQTSLAALRNFFIAQNAHDLENAYTQLCPWHATQSINWRHVEYEFNRLFIGPMAVQAPPYASVYLESEPQIMGRTSLEVRKLYDKLSLTTPSCDQHGLLPDDHIALELDALLALLAIQDWCRVFDASSDVSMECHTHLSWLVDHMNVWVPQFVHKAVQSKKNTTQDTNISLIIAHIMPILLYTIDYVAKYKNNATCSDM